MTGRLSELLDLQPIGDPRDHSGAPWTSRRFAANPPGEGFLFGGLTMAIGLRAAGATVDGAFIPKSLHALFLRPGSWGPTIDVEVANVHDGRAFAIRRVTLSQNERTVAEVTAALHVPEHGEDRQLAHVPDHPAPETLDADGALLAMPRVMEVRPITPIDRSVSETAHPYWARFADLPDDDPMVRSCAVTFVSDYMVIYTPFPKGSNEGADMISRTTSHSLFFHRPAETDWLLLSSTPVNLGHGRFTSTGTVHDQLGGLVASFVQEGILRAQ
jgi:acyl-CoA thioesterase-2